MVGRSRYCTNSSLHLFYQFRKRWNKRNKSAELEMGLLVVVCPVLFLVRLVAAPSGILKFSDSTSSQHASVVWCRSQQLFS
jgi:hypothetical protein